MILSRLAALVVTAALAGGALAQTPAGPKPGYDELMASVTEAECARSEGASFIFFRCEHLPADWFFTKPGRPEHPGYVGRYAQTVDPDRPLALLPTQAFPADRTPLAGADLKAFMLWSASLPRYEKLPPADQRGRLYRLAN